MRTSFTGLRGVIGSWQLLLGLGGLYLLSDSLDKNLAKAETEIGAKSKEALLALHGTQLALLGGGMEVLGITLREGFKHASASGFASSAFKSGVSLVKAGSIISAAAGLYDATQTTLSIRRTFLAGDENASIGYFIAGTLHILEISLAISAISTPLVLGPLGLAITFGILAYHASNRAGKNESTPLEQWIKRCYFGKANETPVIHWNTPELADIALAELNAATLGLEAIIGFEAHKTSNPTTGKIGGLVSLTVDQSLKLLIKIPDFDENRSGYRWHLVVHRQSDKHGYAHAQGEEIASNEFNPPPGTESNTFILQLRPSHLPKFPDHKKDTIITKKTDHALGRNAKYRKITGAVELNPEIAEHNIKAATLVITYWPNRSIPNAYSEIIRQEIRS
ncbi:oxidoreductase [Pseudomonas monteilii]|nr:oxidoreductase [Pseudomonas monteilii]